MKILFIILIIMLLLYVLSIKPRSIRKQEIWDAYEKVYIAHRGYFNNNKEYPENSLPAFARAVDNHFGIELDVQMTTDGKLVVFHDDTLKRMCNIDKMLTDLTFEECQKYTLSTSKEHIPLFRDVLKIIDGKVPLIVEIKSEGNYIETVKKTCKMLESYKGIYVMESFHPGVVYWLKKNKPDIIRGQLSEDYAKYKDVNIIGRIILANCMLNGFTKPDFVAYDYNCRNYFGFKIMCKLFKFKKVCWTIKNKEDLNIAKNIYDVYIFDSFDPRI